MSESLVVSGVSVAYRKENVLKDVSFELESGQVIAIVGESGSGKTSLLRVIAGHEPIKQGKIIISGEDHTASPPEKRNIGLVFQEYALFPHLTVEKNICYGLKKKNVQLVDKLLGLMGLPDIKKRYPHELSGGQQQRVAIARALAPNPSFLLMDEPFSNLDPIRRRELRSELKNIVEQSNMSLLVVTHDANDALKLADQIIVLKDGAVIQQGTPDDLIKRPADPYIEEFISS